MSQSTRSYSKQPAGLASQQAPGTPRRPYAASGLERDGHTTTGPPDQPLTSQAPSTGNEGSDSAGNSASQTHPPNPGRGMAGRGRPLHSP